MKNKRFAGYAAKITSILSACIILQSGAVPENTLSPAESPSETNEAEIDEAEFLEKDIVFSSHENESMKIALTFDDGPHGEFTSQILDVLRMNGVRATFFVLGVNVKRHPELLLREIAEGHEIGNHTFTHPCSKIEKLSQAELISEILKTENIVYENSEYRTRLFRPPGGKNSLILEKIAEKLDYSIILWNIDTRDWKYTTPEKITENVLSNVDSGDIILCHDYVSKESTTIEALRMFIPELKKMGYNFVTVSELIMSK